LISLSLISIILIQFDSIFIIEQIYEILEYQINTIENKNKTTHNILAVS
jgi:hypothetical protein